ncbi:L-dopachrome tautomerase-related protein [Phytohalomonas tamaricis]|uniref:L-dopachrome tautomerase-related protein n=1 Tax=Phytohalomonas tamaricis TaxID=2081032 RepID=UPI000D0B9784|nr:L-dopachrome tautomerase-related protein [Phytohalomonas tamaricis]
MLSKVKTDVAHRKSGGRHADHRSRLRRAVAGAAFCTLPLTLPAMALGAPAAQHDTAMADLAHEHILGELSPVFLFNDQMPTGVTVSAEGRIFVSYPRWENGVEFTVAELKNGKEIPYPNAKINAPDVKHPEASLISVQSVVAPGDGHVWLLDTGRLPDSGYQAKGAQQNGAKLVAVDLASNQIDRTIVLPDDAALDSTYLNDVRFDFSQGQGGVAYITDSSFAGPGAIIVVDLASGEAWRKLSGHASTQADPEFVPIVEGQRLTLAGTKKEQINRVPADGIALSSDGATLYYSALSGRHFYSVPTRLLLDRNASDDDTAAAVKDLGEKGGASDGMLMDASGRLYTTDYEHNAIHRYDTGSGTWETLVHDPHLLWPDTLSIGPNGGLYVTANQLERQASYQGQDKRQKPYVLFRLNVDAQPIGTRR